MRFLTLLALAGLLPAAMYACSDDSTVDTTPTDAGGDVSTKPGDASNTDTGLVPDASPPNEAGPDGGKEGGLDAGHDARSDSGVDYLCPQEFFDVPCGEQGGDCTALSRVEILFPTDILPEQYTHHCVKVKVGTVVAFGGKFSLHNLHGQGGDLPTPIPSLSTDPSVGASGRPETDITMATANRYYGFECQQHPTVMFGAIEVVP